MSLENNLYVPENVGFYNEQTVFTVVSQIKVLQQNSRMMNPIQSFLLLTEQKTIQAPHLRLGIPIIPYRYQET